MVKFNWISALVPLIHSLCHFSFAINWITLYFEVFLIIYTEEIDHCRVTSYKVLTLAKVLRCFRAAEAVSATSYSHRFSNVALTHLGFFHFQHTMTSQHRNSRRIEGLDKNVW